MQGSRPFPGSSQEADFNGGINRPRKRSFALEQFQFQQVQLQQDQGASHPYEQYIGSLDHHQYHQRLEQEQNNFVSGDTIGPAGGVAVLRHQEKDQDQDQNHDHDQQEGNPKSKRVTYLVAALAFLLIILAIVLTATLVTSKKSSSENSGLEAGSNSTSSLSPLETNSVAQGNKPVTLSNTASSTLTTTTTTLTSVSSTTTTPDSSRPYQPTSGSPQEVGNCQSGSYPFEFNSGSLYIQYGASNVQTNGGAMTIALKNQGQGQAGSGAAVSTSRYHWYGKFSTTIKAINRGGVITTFITMSPSGDEIDVEICGNPVAPYTNVFYSSKTVAPEYFTHFSTIYGFDMSVAHTYTIDWKHDSITWLVDGQVVRTLLKKDSLSANNPNGPKWFPVTPSQVQFGVWDASYVADYRTVQWAGGPLQWGSDTELYATFSNFQVTCYDPNDNPVSKWP